MWKLYSTNVNNALAIQTTYQQLYEALDKDPAIEIGKVKYVYPESVRPLFLYEYEGCQQHRFLFEAAGVHYNWYALRFRCQLLPEPRLSRAGL